MSAISDEAIWAGHYADAAREAVAHRDTAMRTMRALGASFSEIARAAELGLGETRRICSSVDTGP